MARKEMRVFLTVVLAITSASVWSEAATYTIREGQTVFGIAKKAGIPADVLCLANGIDTPGRVKAGTTIRVPPSYVVRKGDTLYGIARDHSVTLQKLLSLNRLGESVRLKAGMRLYLPLGTDSPGAGEQSTAARQNPVARPDGSGKTDPAGGQGGDAAPAAGDPASPHKGGRTWPHGGKREPWTGKVTGVLFHGSRDDPVVAAAAGEVKWVGPYWGYGKTVLIRGEDGLVFMYAGNEELLVNVGDRVAAGSEIAKLGVSPQGGGAILYFSIQGRTGQFVDPVLYITKG
jgi:lipoprotein NlpD